MQSGESTDANRDRAAHAKQGVFRFCVGTASLPLSSVWKICVRKDNIYIFSSGLGSNLKASIHASGFAHWSVSAEWFLRRGVQFRNQDRHVVRWDRRNPEPTKAAHIFRIILPASELRQHGAVPVEKRITWLTEPPPSTAWEIEVYLTPPRPNAPRTATSPYRQLALLQTESANWVALLAHQEEVTREKSRTLIAARRRAKKLVAQSALGRREVHAIGFLQSPDNPPGLIELVLLAGLLRVWIRRIRRWSVRSHRHGGFAKRPVGD